MTSNRKAKTGIAAVMLSVCTAANAWIGGVTVQKFIGHGWDTLRASPEQALAHADEFARTGLDGITVCLYGKNKAGKSFGMSTIMTDPPWEYATLEKRTGALRRFKDHPGLKESFLMFWLAPQKRLAWDDDAAWARFAGNLDVLARLGAETGMKGYFIDGEDYPKTRQFFHDREKDGMDYDEACRTARKRGAEVFGRLFARHPDATVLSFWFLSLNQVYVPLRDPVSHMRKSGDLWPAFVNGILDVMPDSATLVDGDEHAYNYDSSRKDFYVKSLNQRHTALGLVAPENRAKYSARLSVGFGLYLDMYGKTADLGKFTRNLTQAAEVSTEYVWVYGEKNNWVGWNKTGTNTWEQVMPGLSDVLFSIKDPETYMKRRMAELVKAGRAVNLIEGRKDAFFTWKADSAKTVFKSDGGVWTVSEGSGSVLAGTPVKEAEMYAASVAVRGNAKANVHWRRKGAFDWNKPEIPLFFGEPDKDGWRRASAAAIVPVDVDELVIHCGCHPGTGEKTETAEFSLTRLR